MLKKIIVPFLSLLLLLSLVGCGSEEQESKSTFNETEKEVTPTTIIDQTGNEVTIPEDIDRIVVVSAAECEIVYALDAGNLVVGRGEYCNYPPEAEEVKVVQSGSDLNQEQIVALDPDIVFMNSMSQTEEQIQGLKDADIEVFVAQSTDIEGTYESISLIGQILGKQDKADSIIESMKATFSELEEKSKDKEGGTVYFEVSPLEYGLWTAGNNTFMNEIANMLNLENIFSDVEGWAEISEEQVLERNPDYIVTITMYFGEGPKPVDEILARPGWQEVTAVQNKNIYNANSDEISRSGPRLADAATMLYDFVYGESND